MKRKASVDSTDTHARTEEGTGRRCSFIRRGQEGFTLVEVIVVLVILAILMAIAVPALTGYIERAKGAQYIADARSKATAVRSVLSELYVTGDLVSTSPAQTYTIQQNGGTSWHIKMWAIGDEGEYYIYQQAAKLMGTKYTSTSKNAWEYYVVGPKVDSATVWNSDGFVCVLFPEGTTNGKPVVVITYKLKRFNDSSFVKYSDLMSAWSSAQYDESAGFEAYMLKTS
jgi:prepilin-type N-terminal cleavage/methylation domain-containing protein